MEIEISSPKHLGIKIKDYPNMSKTGDISPAGLDGKILSTVH